MENDECTCTPSLVFYVRGGFLLLIVVGTTIIDPDMQNGYEKYFFMTLLRVHILIDLLVNYFYIA